MTVSQSYAVASMPPPVPVCGVMLQPFTLGHRLLLERYGSPFITDDRTPAVADLAFAQLVCSRPWKDARRLVRSRWGRFRLWLRGCMIPTHLRTLGCLAMMAYIKASEKYPLCWRAAGGGGKKAKPSNVPFYLEVQLILQDRLGYTEDQVLDMPIGKALWLYFCQGAIDGKTRLKSDRDYAFEAECAAEMAEAAAEETAEAEQAAIAGLQAVTAGLAELAKKGPNGQH